MKYKFIAVIFCLIAVFFIAPKAYANESFETESVALPIIMYHNVKEGKQNSYTVTCKQLDDDLRELKNQGFSAVFPSEIIKWQERKSKLPKKPVLITFDDGHYNNLQNALPLLKKHNMKAVINIIGAFTEFSSISGDHSNANYSHLTWRQIKELENSSYFEIGSHTYNMHNYKPRFGIAPLKDERQDEYIQEIEKDILKLEKKLNQSGVKKSIVFAYPFGEYNKTAREVLVRLGFKILLTCNEGISIIKQNQPQSLLELKRYNRDAIYSTEQVVKILSSGIN